MLTIGILVAVGLRKLPSNATRLEHELSVQTGLRWRIHAVEFRKPGCVRLRGVDIIDDVSTKSIFEAGEIDIERQRDNENENFLLVRVPTSVLKLGHYENDESAARVVHAALAKLLTRFPQLSATETRFDFEKVGIFTTHSRKRQGKIKFETLRFVRGHLYRTENGVRSDWSFELPEVSTLETQRLSFFRRTATGGAEIELRTGKIPIPVEIVSPLCPVFGRFGAGSKFSGGFSLENHSESGSVRTIRIENAVFQNIDLTPIVSNYTTFPVTGTVDTLVVRKAAFGPGTFFADGTFLLVHGEIDSTLFNRFVRQFDLTVSPPEVLESPQKSIPFEQCALQFQAQADGLAFWPDDDWKDLVMYRSGDGFRTEIITVHFPAFTVDAPRRPVSYHSLLSVLAPETAPVVPLTPSLKQIYSVLPVEDEARPKTAVPARTAPTYPAIGNPTKEY